MKFALFFMGEYANMLAGSAMMVTLFFGGWTLPFGGLDQQATTFVTGLIHIGIFIGDRKSTRLNSSHGYISYAVFCLKKNVRRSLLLTFQDPSSPNICPLSLHDALPIS